MNLNKLMVQACTAAILSGSAAGAMAFADDDARRAILDLRAQVAALEEHLQNQNRLLTGQVEELTNAIRQEKRSTRELYTSIDERLGKFEPREVEVNGEKVMVQPQEQAAYDAAVELLKAGDYKKAAAAFSTFGAEWPKSAYAADAVYWRGSCLFALEQYKSTINVQNSLIRSYPKHPRVADAMISVASSQAALGNVKAASATLAKVIKQYPNSDAAKTAAQLQKTLK